MKRITLWLLSTVSVVVLLFGFDASRAPGTSTVAAPPGAVQPATQPAAEPTTGPTAQPSAGTSRTRTVTGAVAATQWGPVQVRLSITGRRITAVSVPQYPAGNLRDEEINAYALPILVQETTDQQSASIDMVSGATVTSVGYLQSLQSALDQAGL